MIEETKYELVKFIDNELELEVSVSPKEETIWMTQTEIAVLFGKDRKTITRHIQNILKEFELKENQVCSKNEHTALDGKKYIVKIYTSINSKLIGSDINAFNNQYGLLEVIYTTKVHDRYIIIDQN